MQDLLTKLIGKEIDVVCSGAASLRGKVVNVEDSVLQIEDDEGQIGYISIDKIVAVWEKRDKDRHTGFVFKN
jgi:RNase P/RNase MRP subunit p29